MYDVLIVGAGLAGLTAADRLLADRFSVHVLEARGRLGGRVESATAGGTIVELGAQFLCRRQRRLWRLAAVAGLRPLRVETQGRALREQAGIIRKVGNLPLPTKINGKIDAVGAFIRLLRQARRLDNAALNDLDRLTARQLIAGVTRSRAAFSFLVERLESELCASTEEVSAWDLLDQISSMGGAASILTADGFTLAEGASRIVEHVAAGLKNRIESHREVTVIEQRADGSVRVLASGRWYAARRVVLTLPPPLISRIEWKPALPESRRAALAGIVPGRVIKTMVVYDRRWWHDRRLSGTVFAPESAFQAVVDASLSGQGKGILAAFSTGNNCSKLVGLDETERVARFTCWCRTVFGHEVPAPAGARSVDWCSEYYSAGGFASRRGLGSWTAEPDLFRPFGRVHFAGSETSRIWRSYMEGALVSGERAAKEILLAERGWQAHAPELAE